MNIRKRLAVGLVLMSTLLGFNNVADAACTDPAGPGVDWSGCDKRSLNLFETNLTGANLTGTNVANTNFTNATLTNATVINAFSNCWKTASQIITVVKFPKRRDTVMKIRLKGISMLMVTIAIFISSAYVMNGCSSGGGGGNNGNPQLTGSIQIQGASNQNH